MQWICENNPAHNSLVVSIPAVIGKYPIIRLLEAHYEPLSSGILEVYSDLQLRGRFQINSAALVLSPGTAYIFAEIGKSVIIALLADNSGLSIPFLTVHYDYYPG